jgi:hypothetical protein
MLHKTTMRETPPAPNWPFVETHWRMGWTPLRHSRGAM